MVTSHRVTVDQYLAMPETKPYLEYYDGEVRQKMAADYYHSAVAARLVVVLSRYTASRGGFVGPEARVDLVEEGHQRFLLPDVAYWARGRRVRGQPAMTPPTLAVEIRSPGESMTGQREKCRIYRASGVDVCWLIDPPRQLVERFEGEDDAVVIPTDAALESPHLPGFSVSLGELFGGLDEVV